jgi:hypothetical protein
VFINGYECTVANISGVDPFNYNVYWNNGSTVTFAVDSSVESGITNWRSASGHDANSQVLDPEFVGSGSYKLQSGSDALTASSTSGPVGCYITGNEIMGVRTA